MEMDGRSELRCEMGKPESKLTLEPQNKVVVKFSK